jgi:subtilisin family serine protease
MSSMAGLMTALMAGLAAGLTPVPGGVDRAAQQAGPARGADAQVSVSEKLVGDLAARLAAASAMERIPVVISLAEQVSGDELKQVTAQARTKEERRALVVSTLQAIAQESQAGVLAQLEAERQAGHVGDDIRPLWITNVILAEMNREAIYRIAARSDVESVSEESIIGEEVLPVIWPEKLEIIEPGGGPLAAIECGVDLMDADRVWNELGITGRGAVVAVIDTGCCWQHPDLINQVWKNPGEIPNNRIDDDGNGFVDDIIGWNFWQNNNDPWDSGGHGTHVTGTVCGDGTNGQQTGMAPDALFMTLKYYVSFAGEGTVWQSHEYAVANGAHIITVSSGWPLGYTSNRAKWRQVCENSIAAGVFVNYAAGNENGPSNCNNSKIRTPGDVPDVNTCGATDCSDRLASFSSKGPVTWQDVNPYFDWPCPTGKIKPTVAAPGVDTISTYYDCRSYTRLSGTSMATPHVAGAAALMLEANPDLDHYDIMRILRDTAKDLPPTGDDNDSGKGRVQAFEAVKRALAERRCVGDLDGDKDVDQSDLAILLGDFGCMGGDCSGDVDGDGDTDQADLAALLANFQRICR